MGDGVSRSPQHQPAMLRATYLVVAGTHQGIVAQVATDVGGDDLAVDAIARHEVFVLSRGAGAGGGRVSG